MQYNIYPASLVIKMQSLLSNPAVHNVKEVSDQGRWKQIDRRTDIGDVNHFAEQTEG